MAIQLVISLLFTAVFLFFNNIVVGLDFNFLSLVDLPSALIVTVFPLVFMLILHGWKNTKSAFLSACNRKSNKKELVSAKLFFKNFGNTVFTAASVAFLIAFISIMKDLDDGSALAPNLAFASVNLLYAGLINLIILLPFKIVINRKLSDIEE